MIRKNIERQHLYWSRLGDSAIEMGVLYLRSLFKRTSEYVLKMFLDGNCKIPPRNARVTFLYEHL